MTAWNQRAVIFWLRSRWPLHHQWLPAPLSRFERTAPAHQTERRIAHPCLRRLVGTLPVSWYDCGMHHTFSHPLFSFLPCFRHQGVTNIAFPSKIETWYKRKLQVHILYRMNSCWAYSPIISTVPGFNICAVTAPSRTIEVTVNASVSHFFCLSLTCPYQIQPRSQKY